MSASVVLLAAVSAKAAVTSQNLVFPPPNTSYVSTQGQTTTYPGTTYSVSGVSFATTSKPVGLSSSSTTVDTTWPTTGTINFTYNGAAGQAAISITPDIEIGVGTQPSGQAYTGRLVAVKSISWSYDDESPKETRLSATTPSTGEFDSTQQPDGSYSISSHLDLYTQFSLDQGATWIDGSQPIHLDLVSVPEPTTAVVLPIAAGLLVAGRRRKTGAPGLCLDPSS